MKHVTLAGELKEFAQAAKLMVVHAEPGWLDLVQSGGIDFFAKLQPKLSAHQIASVVVELGSGLSEAMLKQRHMHIILGDRPVYQANVLHAAPAYIWGFWYLDEIGINADSSLRLRTFRPHGLDWDAAQWFFHGVAGYMIENNVSRAEQAPQGNEPLEAARSVVFCQEIEARTPRQHYLTTEAMMRNAARASGGGIVYVKPHPYATASERTRIEALTANDPNLRISDASVHDLIRASDWVVTQNSAAGFEALLHKKKVITCARCDYHHASLVARSEDELRRHLREGAAALDGFEYEKYVYWFLSETCLEPQSDAFADRAWAAIEMKCMP
ncbi:MAG: hypothetical protein AAF647_04965 [Pseudomonadota bacterium]